MAAQYRPFGTYRFLLATLVVVSHTHVLGGDHLSSLLAPFGLGNMGVMSFFVLSGFVITEAISTFYKRRPKAFLQNRLLRIFPPFIVALSFSIMVHWLLHIKGNLLSFDPVFASDKILSVNNIAGNFLCMVIPYGLGKLGVGVDYLLVRYAWAVQVELLFYYTIAAIFFVVEWAFDTNKITNRSIKRCIWLILPTFFLLYFYYSNSSIIYPNWMPYFLLGITIYKLSINAWKLELFLLLFLSLVAVNYHVFIYTAKGPYDNFIESVLILNFLVLCLGILGKIEINTRLKKIDKFLGDVTYPLYLNHYVISLAFLNIIPIAWRGVWWFAFNYLLCILVSYLLMFVCEPFTKSVRDKVRGVAL